MACITLPLMAYYTKSSPLVSPLRPRPSPLVLAILSSCDLRHYRECGECHMLPTSTSERIAIVGFTGYLQSPTTLQPSTAHSTYCCYRASHSYFPPPPLPYVINVYLSPCPSHALPSPHTCPLRALHPHSHHVPSLHSLRLSQGLSPLSYCA